MSESIPITLQDRYRGSLLGLAAGDALGTTLEFRSPGSFDPITDIVGGGPFNLQPGEFTDDTSMALCLIESLIECNGFDATDVMRRFVRWWRHGHLSCTGECFDIGNATSAALESFEINGDPFAGDTNPRTAGNGSIMRLAPIPLFFAAQPERAIEMAAESSRLTHAATECIDACRYLAALIVGALQGHSKEELLADHFDPTSGAEIWTSQPLCPKIDAVAAGSFKRKNPPAIRGTGYVVESLEASLWAFFHGQDFRDVVCRAVNIGDDADTTGAVIGQLAGAFYGVDGIPAKWLSILAMREQIDGFATRLYELGGMAERH